MAGQDRIGRLPVIGELTGTYGSAHPGEYLDGRPVPLRHGTTRRVWVWFVDGANLNLCIDQTGGSWEVRASGPAGYVHLTPPAGTEPGQDSIRGVAVAAGLLGAEGTS